MPSLENTVVFRLPLQGFGSAPGLQSHFVFAAAPRGRLPPRAGPAAAISSSAALLRTRTHRSSAQAYPSTQLSYSIPAPTRESLPSGPARPPVLPGGPETTDARIRSTSSFAGAAVPRVPTAAAAAAEPRLHASSSVLPRERPSSVAPANASPPADRADHLDRRRADLEAALPGGDERPPLALGHRDDLRLAVGDELDRVLAAARVVERSSAARRARRARASSA